MCNFHTRNARLSDDRDRHLVQQLLQTLMCQLFRPFGHGRWIMFGARWRLFRLLGIPVSIDLSWLIILALLTFSLASVFPTWASQYFPRAAPHLHPYTYWIMGLITALAFFGCILLHEFGH